MRQFLPTLLLAALALTIGFGGDLAYRIAGFKPFRPLDTKSLDRPLELDDRDSPRFLAQRNEIQVEVPRDMTAGEFLRLLQFDDYAHVRREIARQEGIDQLQDSTLLRQGRRYTLRLTPPAEGVP
jgi:hypothetical protein